MAATPQELIYNEAQRAVAQQAANLDELRSRMGTLLAVAALSASFLGRAALEENGAPWLELIGGVFLGLVGLLAVIVLFPWAPRERPESNGNNEASDEPFRGWLFTLDAEELAADFADPENPVDINETHLKVAEALTKHYDHNQVPLYRLYACFEAAAICLVLGVGSWLVDLAAF